ncbi:MAG: hypothetical protein IID44_04620 [Planctomycetes bacterium]|nr:hypothetical protein [Planctomycetota bacterium]
MRASTVLTMTAWVALVAASVAGRGAEPGKAKKAADKKNAWQPGKITISKETTRITGPLRKDGYVDYVEALNRRASKGVTPQNNAAVLLLRAMGPGAVDKDVRVAYFKRLGIDLLPEKGDYFLNVGEYLKKTRPKTWEDDDDRFWDADVTAWDRPWSAKQYPLIAGWLKANEKPLRLVAEGVRRPRYYSPLFPFKDEPWLAVAGYEFDMSRYRSTSRSLGLRVRLRVKAGQIDGAREDALTLHLLARRLGQSPSWLDFIHGRTFESVAFDLDVTIAHHGGLSTKQALRHMEALVKLPSMQSHASRVDLNSRFEFLDAVGIVACQGPKTLVEWSGDENKAVAKRLIRLSAIIGIDWDRTLRRGNSWYDQLAAAMGKSTRAARTKAVKQVFERFNRLRTERKDVEALSDRILDAKSRRERLSETLGDYICGLLLSEGLESYYINFDDRRRANERTALLALALAAYRADHGAYPRALSKLAPKYIAKLPRDPFAGADFRYRPVGKGYVLYSVGRNGKDDGGIDPDDDLVIEGLVDSDDRVISTSK